MSLLVNKTHKIYKRSKKKSSGIDVAAMFGKKKV